MAVIRHGGAENAAKLQQRAVDPVAPTDGQVLTWDNADGEWAPATPASGSASFPGIDDQSSSNDDQLTLKDTEVAINDDSDDVDFRVESNGNDHMLLVDGSSDRLGVAIQTPPNTFSVCPVFYSTGTASQSGTTVTGVGTTWTAAMIGSEFVYADGTSSGVITARASNTSISVKTSQTVASQAYKIHYQGLHVKSDGTIGVGTKDPEYALDLHGHIGGSYQLTPRYIRFGAENDIDDIAGGVIFKSAFDGYSKISAKMVGICEGNFGRTALAWHTGDDSDASTNAPERMRLSKEGNLGLAVTDPAEKLQVDGVVALKEQSSSASSTAAYAKIYSEEYGNDANVKLLLHMDGADDGTTFTDSSASAHTVTATGAVTKTAVKKFGTASAYFDGSDVLTIADSADFTFGADPFTIEFWAYPTSIATTWQCLAFMSGSNEAIALGYESASGQDYGFFIDINNGGSYNATPGSKTGKAGIYDDTWYHVAFVREATELRCYLNGVLKNTYDIGTTAINDPTGDFTIGGPAGSGLTNDYRGYFDEFTITKEARYTADFTPARSAFPVTNIVIVDDNGGEYKLGRNW